MTVINGDGGIRIFQAGIAKSALDTDGTLAANSDSKVPSQKAVKTYVDTPRVVSAASSATPTPNADTTDLYILTALGEAAEFGAPTGTPVQGQSLILRIKDDATARALTWNAIYRNLGALLPATTIISKTLYIGLIYNLTDTKWDAVAVIQE